MKRNKKSRNSVLTNEKKQKIQKFCTTTRSAHTLTLRELSQLIGNFVASMEAVPYGRIFYRQLERDKVKFSKQNKQNFEAKVTLPDLEKQKFNFSLFAMSQSQIFCE